MEFRYGPEDPAVELTLDEFWELVRAGRVPPTALYRNPWTEGRWDTVDNLRSFHRKSPVKHPPGARLAEKLSAELAREEAGKREAARMNDYWHGGLIEDVCLVPRLEAVAEQPGVQGAARLFILPSFHHERLLTVAFASESLRLEAVRAGVKVSESVNEWSSPTRWESTFAYREVPRLFRSWKEFAGTAATLGDCSREDCLDGIGFRHLLRLEGRTIEMSWWNPGRPKQPAQLAVLDAYGALLESAGLPEFAAWLRDDAR